MSATRSVLDTVAANLVMGVITSTCGRSCSDPILCAVSAPCPPMCRTGLSERNAVAMPWDESTQGLRLPLFLPRHELIPCRGPYGPANERGRDGILALGEMPHPHGLQDEQREQSGNHVECHRDGEHRPPAAG